MGDFKIFQNESKPQFSNRFINTRVLEAKNIAKNITKNITMVNSYPQWLSFLKCLSTLANTVATGRFLLNAA